MLSQNLQQIYQITFALITQTGKYLNKISDNIISLQILFAWVIFLAKTNMKSCVQRPRLCFCLGHGGVRNVQRYHN